VNENIHNMNENIHSIGGYARAAKLKPKHRTEIATKAAVIRWSNNEKPQASTKGIKYERTSWSDGQFRSQLLRASSGYGTSST
jgi:hypothetical protein